LKSKDEVREGQVGKYSHPACARTQIGIRKKQFTADGPFDFESTHVRDGSAVERHCGDAIECPELGIRNGWARLSVHAIRDWIVHIGGDHGTRHASTQNSVGTEAGAGTHFIWDAQEGAGR